MQVIYGGSAREPDLTGLLVLKSDPIRIIVSRPAAPPGTISVYSLFALLGAAGTAILTLTIRRAWSENKGRRPLMPWLDLVPLLLIAALALGWYFDSRRFDREIRRIQPDKNADWVMTLAE